MESSIFFITIAALALGLVAGFLLTRTFHPQEKQRRELEEKLQRVLDEHKQYQQDVTKHFITTSELVNTLTESYRGLHEHLASSAMHLANPEISRQLIDAGYGRISIDDNNHNFSDSLTTPPIPPKDYAPKVPGGVLSEDYGLKDEEPTAPNPQGAANTTAETDEKDLDSDPTLKVG